MLLQSKEADKCPSVETPSDINTSTRLTLSLPVSVERDDEWLIDAVWDCDKQDIDYLV